MSERLQKIMARHANMSRRNAEELIALGEVTINGKIAKLGDKADPSTDAVKVRGKLLQTAASKPIYVALNKPKGVISMFTIDRSGRKTLTDLLEKKLRAKVFPIGRMEFNAEGLLLLTNDGTSAEGLLKNRQVPVIYHVKLSGQPTPKDLEKISRGIREDGRLTRPHSVVVRELFSKKALVEITFLGMGPVDMKGLFARNGFLVDRVIRVGIGQLSIRSLAPGHFVFLKKSQVEALTKQPDLYFRTRY